MNAVLQRLTSSDKGIFGVIIIDDMPRFVTCEPPWRNNERNISCIPAGTYQVIKMHSPRFNTNVCMLIDIPGRDAVEIHIGNDIKDTHGCVLIGMQFSLNGYAISYSERAFDTFMSLLPNRYTLTIKDCDNVKTTITSQV